MNLPALLELLAKDPSKCGGVIKQGRLTIGPDWKRKRPHGEEKKPLTANEWWDFVCGELDPEANCQGQEQLAEVNEELKRKPKNVTPSP